MTSSVGVADSGYDLSIMRSLQPWVGAIHELPLPKVSYLNPATPIGYPSIRPLPYINCDRSPKACPDLHSCIPSASRSPSHASSALGTS